MFKALAAILLLTGLIIFGFWTVGAYDCWKKLSDSTYDYRYKLLKGCQYQSKNGWLNYDRLRDIAE